jgi:mono/diheme cytochrome c family protein
MCFAFRSCVLLALLTASPLIGQEKPRSDTAPQVDFERDIRPIFAKHCFSCHGPESHEGGLRLHQKAAAMAGGDRGEILVAGKSAESRLIQFVTGKNDESVLMPPEGEGQPLSREQIAMLRAWIDQGARWPDDANATAKSKHWSFQPIVRPPVPAVTNTWPRNEIDHFVLAKLESLGIKPSPEADKATLIRRLSLDLLGLPPTP